MNLEPLRRKIDIADEEIIIAISKRMETVRLIADYKKKDGIPIFDSDREKEVIERIRKYAEESDINPDFAEKIFRLIIEESKRIQNRKFTVL